MAKSLDELKRDIQTSKEQFRSILDEARVKLHILGMDAKDVVTQLSKEAEELGHTVSESSRSAWIDLVNRARKLIQRHQPQH